MTVNALRHGPQATALERCAWPGCFEGLTGRIRVVGRRVPLSLILNQHYFSHTLRIRNRFLRVQLHTHHRRITS